MIVYSYAVNVTCRVEPGEPGEDFFANAEILYFCLVRIYCVFVNVNSLSNKNMLQTKAFSVDLNMPGVCTSAQAGHFVYFKNLF